MKKYTRLSEIPNTGIKKHGLTKTKIHGVWSTMKTRCYNKNNWKFKHYGGRGINVCEEWRLSFESFNKWAIENGYLEGLQIDRIDNNGNYEPNNCRWVTAKENANNRRYRFSAMTYEHEGKIISLMDISKMTGIQYNTLLCRAKAGKSLEELFRQPFT